jgi:hypothetical protein
MAETSWPYDGQLSYEDNWREMASKWLGDGVIYGELNNLAITADSTGMNVKEATGKAWVKGTYYSNDAIRTLAINAAPSAGNVRCDRVVLRNDFVANSTVALVVPGTPIAIPGTPAVPALTRSTTVWDVSLGQVLVTAGTVTIGPSAVTDDRSYAVPLNTTFAPYQDVHSAPLTGTMPLTSQLPARLRMTGGQAIVTSNAQGFIYLQVDAASVGIVSAWCNSGDLAVDAGWFVANPTLSNPANVWFLCYKASSWTTVAVNTTVRVNWGCIYAV